MQLTFLLVLLAFGQPFQSAIETLAPAAAHSPAVVTRMVTLFDGLVKIDLPENLTQQSSAQIATAIPDAAKRPDAMFSSAEGTTKLTFILKASPARLTPEIMEAIRPMLAPQLAASMEGATILTNEVREFNGRKCIYLDIKARKDGVDVRVFMIVAGVGDKMLLVNYGLPANQVNEAKKREVLAMFNSLQLRD